MQLMSEVMAHTITLHLLNATGRVQRFVRKHGELLERIPKKGIGVLPESFAGDAEPAEAAREDLKYNGAG